MTADRHAVKQVLHRILDLVFARRRRLRDGDSVLLTFDDGPNPDVTPLVLDRLNAYNARAVFFIIGSLIRTAPHLLPRIMAEGHILGNHSYASHWRVKETGPVACYRDLRCCQAEIKELTGRVPSLYRPPFGRTDISSLLVPRLLGLRHVLWSQSENDWAVGTPEDAAACGQRLASKVKPGDIVLLHESNPWLTTVLDVLLPRLKQLDVDLRSGVDRI